MLPMAGLSSSRSLLVTVMLLDSKDVIRLSAIGSSRFAFLRSPAGLGRFYI
jgi:hypothetical protein